MITGPLPLFRPPSEIPLGFSFKLNTLAPSSVNKTFVLPLGTSGGYTQNFTVYWGDGSSDVITNYDNENKTHTYSLDGIYDVTIDGTCEYFGVNAVADGKKIIKVNSWGDAHFKILNFSGCTNLTELPSEVGKLTEVTDFTYFVDGCTSLISIPSGIFDNNTIVVAFSAAFRACSSLVSIPVDLFRYNTSASFFPECFKECSSLVSIPADLFRYSPVDAYLSEYYAFLGCFESCSSLEEIPEDLFRYQPQLKWMLQVFKSCTSLTELPDGLFQYNAAIINLYQCFVGCSGLTTLPEDLLRYCVNLAECELTFGYSHLTELPSGLFQYNTLLSNLDHTFSNNYYLTAIPSGFFNNNVNILSFAATFAHCGSVTSIPTDLFKYNTKVTTVYACFCQLSITSLPVDLFRYNTLVTSFKNTFFGSTHLESVPANLFKYNVLVTDFSGCFNSCDALQLRSDIFYENGDQDTRFLNKLIDFTGCFYRTSFTGTQGVAPDLWECNFGSETPVTTNGFNGTGNSTVSISNYNDIPIEWKS